MTKFYFTMCQPPNTRQIPILPCALRVASSTFLLIPFLPHSSRLPPVRATLDPNSMDLFPAAPARPSWLILDRFIHRSDRDVEDEADGTASEISYTCTGRPIRASIGVADSPAVSRLFLDWPSRPEFGGRLQEPHVIAAHDHSILLRAIVPLEDPMCCNDTYSFPVDLFVYSAFSSPPSLHRLPTCFIGGVSTPDEDIYFKPYQRRQQRTMVEAHIGLLCHGREGGFTVVDFTNFDLEGGELCLLHHHALLASASHKNTVRRTSRLDD